LFGLVPYPGSDMYKSPDAYNMTILHHDYEYYVEDLLPVFRSNLTCPEQVYRVFLDGVQEIGRTMAKTPYLHSSQFPSDSESFGAFWVDQA